MSNIWIRSNRSSAELRSSIALRFLSIICTGNTAQPESALCVFLFRQLSASGLFNRSAACSATGPYHFYQSLPIIFGAGPGGAFLSPGVSHCIRRIRSQLSPTPRATSSSSTSRKPDRTPRAAGLNDAVCLRCLRKGHRRNECKDNPAKCSECGADHHLYVCPLKPDFDATVTRRQIPATGKRLLQREANGQAAPPAFASTASTALQSYSSAVQSPPIFP